MGKNPETASEFYQRCKRISPTIWDIRNQDFDIRLPS